MFVRFVDRFHQILLKRQGNLQKDILGVSSVGRVSNHLLGGIFGFSSGAKGCQCWACLYLCVAIFFPGLSRGVQNKRILHTQGHTTCTAQFNFLSRCYLCLVTESLTTELLQRLFELLLFRSLTTVSF